jgi:glycerol transport system permease protein
MPTRLGHEQAQTLALLLYILFLLVPIYWLLNMSFKSNTEILGGLTLWPQAFTFDNYKVIFTDPAGTAATSTRCTTCA